MNKQPVPKFIYAETQNKPISSITTIKYENPKHDERLNALETKLDDILACVKHIKDKLSQYDIESEGEQESDEITELEEFLESDKKERKKGEES